MLYVILLTSSLSLYQPYEIAQAERKGLVQNNPV